jgi:hypothetical protein
VESRGQNKPLTQTLCGPAMVKNGVGKSGEENRRQNRNLTIDLMKDVLYMIFVSLFIYLFFGEISV